MLRPLNYLFLGFATLLACSPSTQESSSETTEETTPSYPTVGSVDRLDAELDQIISTDAHLDFLAEGVDWSVGPVWVTE